MSCTILSSQSMANGSSLSSIFPYLYCHARTGHTRGRNFFFRPLTCFPVAAVRCNELRRLEVTFVTEATLPPTEGPDRRRFVADEPAELLVADERRTPALSEAETMLPVDFRLRETPALTVTEALVPEETEPTPEGRLQEGEKDGIQK